jgi:hypothetical protein
MIDGESTPEAQDAPHSTPGSVWGALRERHKEVSDNTDPLYLDDPIHPGVVLRYHYVPLRNTTQASKRISKLRDPAAQTLASAVETILLSIDEILVVHPDGEVPTGVTGRELYSEPLRPLAEPGEPPMKFDERLCAGMEFPEGTSRVGASIVFHWFAKKEYILIEHAQEVSASFTEVAEDVRDEFEESLGKA